MHRSPRVRSGRMVRLLLVALLTSTVAVVGGAGPVAAVEHPPAFLTAWGTYGSGNGQFDGPNAVAVDPTTGDVYVTDFENSRVQKFDADGTFLIKWGTPGSGNGQFRGPYGVAVDPTTGNVYVADTLNDRVQKFDADGTYLGQWGTSGSGNGQFNYPYGVAVDPTTGNVNVTDTLNDRVQRFDADGNFLTKWGTFGSGNGQFNLPQGVAVNPTTGDVYVTDVLNDRVQKFGGCGHPFIDVPDWVTSAVNWASCGEYLTGYADDTFRPNRPMTRAEVARFLYRVAGSPDVSGLAAHGFSDVPAWVEEPVRWLAANGYITGYGDGTFRPNLAITRAQVIRMLYRIAGSPTGAPDHGFTDVPAWVDTAVDWIVDPVNDPPYATGYGDGTFRPNLDITRAQTTRMACRINTTPGTC